ncbi:serrate RNA effector molecule-like [Nymphaea colorata]|nr:serrate RNA effector molecule-like [Nymphaea colorata]
MAEVMDMPAEALDRGQERQTDRKDKTSEELPRKRDRDSRERRDERDSNRRGEHYERNRSPSRDRDREYRRRSSLSPPPYVSRERWHSPSRHSPPPFKRGRRGDGHDHRRSSPRGGFGSDDGRFGYDYIGRGYDRGGGRPGYHDERAHGRHGYQDWSDSHFVDRSNTMGGPQREGLMSYKQFILELEDDILPAEAERRYEEYRSEYISTQKCTFFDTHKDEEWLKDKYHPTNLLTVIERRNENAKALAKEFLLDLQSGTVDLGPSVIALSAKSGPGSEPNSEDEADATGKRRRHGRGSGKENELLSAAPKAHPVSGEPRRIQTDVLQAQALVWKLDAEKGIEDNVLSSVDQDKLDAEKSHGGSMGPIVIIRGLSTVKGLEGVELLDTILTYLWRVHGLDYYGMTETNEPKGLRHVRGESKSYGGANVSSATEWEKKLDTLWQGRLQRQDPLVEMTAKDKIDAATIEALDPFVRKIRDEKYGWKYGCGAKGCTKLFHAVEFVHKHLKLKHSDLVMELTSKIQEDLYFQNYTNDPNAPGGMPVLQQPGVKNRPHRRRLGSDGMGRPREERSSRREHDRADRVSGRERYDRGENSPSHDYQSGEHPDSPLRDAYGGPGIRGAPFSSDAPPPPPVLMPVPGAGPLGPFVPAPPEVAMRMLRDQGGPGPLEGNGGARGRIGRPGPSAIGAGPIIAAVPPAFGQDPRRIRSYQDLDAPEDEVTVIDYRSL